MTGRMMTEYWQKDVETMSRGELASFQAERLRRTVETAARSPFYGAAFQRAGVAPENVSGSDDLRRLPVTTKDDLRAAYPYGLLAVGKEELVRLHSSSGTTGSATVIFHTRHDLDSWTNLVARCLYMVGVRPGDVFQNMMGYGLFTGGLGLHYGAEKVGALTIPAGAGNSKRQISLMRDFGTTVVHIIPSYALRLADEFRREGFDPRRDTRLRVAVLGAEPHSEGARRRLEEVFGFRAYNCYGLSELNGPGVAFECPEQDGMHLWEDAFLAEVVDPDTLEPVPEGEEGELILTNLDRTGMPLVRYRTKDLTRFIPGPCPCGRTHRRIDRIKGRTDDMLILKGVNIYPIQVERVLMGIPGVGSAYLITLSTDKWIDQMKVSVEIDRSAFTGDLRSLEDLRRRITGELRDEILITPIVDLVEPDSLPKSEGKAVRVIDERKK
jgi:phenylacetate-CoA ligase